MEFGGLLRTRQNVTAPGSCAPSQGFKRTICPAFVVGTCRRLPDEDPSVREVRISCPDATGLGVDLTRVLLDFGLRILKGDISTDGKW